MNYNDSTGSCQCKRKTDPRQGADPGQQRVRRRLGSYCVSTRNADILAMITHADIWEIVCSYLDGDAIFSLSQVQFFAQSTKQTPAYQLLSGINNDGFLVPWDDVDNAMSIAYNHNPVSPDPFLSFARNAEIYNVAIQLLKGTLFSQSHPDYGTYHSRGGPARPSSPVCVAPAFKYRLPNPFNYDEGGPAAAVFGLGNGFLCPPFWQVLVDGYCE